LSDSRRQRGAEHRPLADMGGGLSGIRLDRLEKAGLVRCEKGPHDGRSVHVVLTDKGMACAEEAFRADMASELKFLEPLNAQERQMLATQADWRDRMEALDASSEPLRPSTACPSRAGSARALRRALEHKFPALSNHARGRQRGRIRYRR
jgi:DNA-binding MarR family transcriptional regulator